MDELESQVLCILKSAHLCWSAPPGPAHIRCLSSDLRGPASIRPLPPIPGLANLRHPLHSLPLIPGQPNPRDQKKSVLRILLGRRLVFFKLSRDDFSKSGLSKP